MPRFTVQRFMTARPHVVSSQKTLAQAHQAMREKGIRHLPVVDGGKLVGVVSQRDLYLLETLKGVDIARETIEEAMTADPITVPPDAPLDEVAEAMAARKQGSAVVVDRGAVVGIFTTTDAMKALVAVLRRSRRPRGGGEDED
jgi:acetoin utilization protein AcuB